MGLQLVELELVGHRERGLREPTSFLGLVGDEADASGDGEDSSRGRRDRAFAERLGAIKADTGWSLRLPGTTRPA